MRELREGESNSYIRAGFSYIRGLAVINKPTLSLIYKTHFSDDSKRLSRRRRRMAECIRRAKHEGSVRDSRSNVTLACAHPSSNVHYDSYTEFPFSPSSVKPCTFLHPPPCPHFSHTSAHRHPPRTFPLSTTGSVAL